MRGVKRIPTLLILACLAFTAGCTAGKTGNQDLILRGETAKSFNDVIEELEFAITEHNFRITGANKIGAGLRDRGYKDFPDVQVIHFCSLENAYEVLSLDLDYVAQMPCRVAVYRKGDKTVIDMLLLPEDHPDPRVNEFAHRINGVLREIFNFAMASDAPTIQSGQIARPTQVPVEAPPH